jgi:hypothetical protein
MPERILVKLRPSAALGVIETRAKLEPLYETPPGGAAFGIGETSQWFLADVDESQTAWDSAHASVAAQLGVAESDVIFAEPDIIHTIFNDGNEVPPGQAFAVGENCNQDPQDAQHGKVQGPGFAWHLDKSGLRAAAAAVQFTEPRTRIAHIDTGYYAEHVTVPKHVKHELERSFVDGDKNPSSAVSPGNHPLLLDNHDHGTGTLSILAGGSVPAFNQVMGAAPDAEVLPIRVADSVVLLRTSALARGLIYATQNGCDVVTLSMGGLPTDAWADAVDKAYDAGVCICAAAGNHTGKLPPNVMVYPARYPRVIAVCGVMANDKPYIGLQGVLEGCFGPDSVMKAAVAAYTPNIPWARFGCKDIVRLNGEGTSSATPQVAAAVALWFEKNKKVLPRNYQRVEAVRKALFDTASNLDPAHFGRGIMQANKALGIAPVLGLPQSARSTNSFAFLRLITGLGIVEQPAQERMFNLELAQRWLANPDLIALVADPDATQQVDPALMKKVMQAIIEDKGASLTLRRHIASRYPIAGGGPAPRTDDSKDVVPDVLRACDAQPAVPTPAYRRIRVYALDPTLSTRLDTAEINEVALKVRWESLEKGPSGEYVKVEDTDAAGVTWDGVDLNEPRLLAQDGWAPSEGNPQFHQQMVYAVAMKTIEHFEAALGRPVLWRAEPKEKEYDDSGFIRQLPILPHALRQANAYYSPATVSLQFGYFEVGTDDPGQQMPGSRVYSCLSHDIVAHVMTHAILDGMHRRFSEPTNIDVLAFHEAFADIVALMQHFTIPEVVEHEIRKTRGDIEAESLLGSLALQFGYATGTRGALRDAIGHFDKDGKWVRFQPDPSDLQNRLTPHSRGAILVGAVFDAFIAIYKERTADLMRIATGGTGVLNPGAIHPDLVSRLSEEATKSATHVLKMCIRALDYLPPVDVTFFEYLRALITADYDIVRDDRHNYRVAFVESFRRRAIYPLNVDTSTQDTPRTLSVDTLRWQGLDLANLSNTREYKKIISGLKSYANECFYLDNREKLFRRTRVHREILHRQLGQALEANPKFAEQLGLDSNVKSFEVHTLRRAIRVSPDGARHLPQIVVALTQLLDVTAKDGTPAHTFRGGSTLVVDLSVPEVKYRITKRLTSADRQERTATFLRDATSDPLRAILFAPGANERFAVLHAI